MNFSIARTTRRLLASRHEVSCPWWTWQRLVRTLRERGHRGQRESGAFLLGHRDGVVARIERYVPYDDLDPNCLDSGIVHFDGRHYGKLWELCRREELAVVADVHTHPGGVQQSGSDQAHPMVAQAGHLALILPRFAMGRFGRDGIGMYRYLGARRWETVPPAARRDFFHIGL